MSVLVQRLAMPVTAGALAAAAAVVVATYDRERSLEVTATAYNSVEWQTDHRPNHTAFGHILEPGMRAIAVSRDLLALGLDSGTVVHIDGLPGAYVVRDTMARRWQKRIDIYMGEDIEAARDWGVREVTVRWREAR